MLVFFEIEDWSKEVLESQDWRGRDVVFESKRLTEETAPAFANAEVVSTFIYSEVTSECLRLLPSLKLIATRSTGFDHIDTLACRERGIQVCNVPHYGENTVAEHAFGLMLALSRNIHKAYQRTSKFDFTISGLRGFDLYGRTLGVIGAGSIGLHVIRIGKGFGMKVLAYDTRPQRLISEVLGFDYVDFDTLLANSDVVSLHLPLVPSTRHIINKERISKMKPGAILINTGRGALVDTAALIEALDSGHLSGAGLDVIEGEELIMEEAQLVHSEPSEESLRAMIHNYRVLRRDNVVVTPHIGFYSIEAEHRILDTTIQNIRSYIDGLDVANIVI